ncbi:MAG: DNA polymerase III subunit beta [Rickettsiales bacterium]|nr:DNA polymerase III subunit beta [Rickettsiales bacterium]MDG4546184.1 DNA polymerase III subunit beta [Rickettsiales bacterium]MDG4547657.1 DNA polymerase III subunit beta [Rickettsiales bacterium]
MTELAEVRSDEQQAENISSSLGFTIDRSQLLKALGHVQSVVERRNTIAILSNVKIEAFGGQINLTATDMDIAVTEKLEADISEEGALTVSAHTLYEIVRKLPDGAQVSIKGDASDTGHIEIASGSCNFSLACLPVTDFPVMSRGDMPYEFSLTAAELTALIDKPRFAISTEETRYYLNGIYIHSTDKMLCAVATDGHRLAKIEIEAPEGASEIPGVIIPRKTVVELKKLLDEAEDDIEVSLSDTKICFVCGKAVLLSKLIDGTFPDYTKVIPQSNDKSLVIDSNALSVAVDRVSTISSDKTKAVKLTVSAGKIVLSATNDDNGAATEELEANYNSDSVEIGFNSRYILDMMGVIEGDEVEFVFADGSAPVLVKDSADSSSLYVIMPMRI